MTAPYFNAAGDLVITGDFLHLVGQLSARLKTGDPLQLVLTTAGLGGASTSVSPGGTQVTEHTPGFYTPTSTAAIAFYGAAPLSLHQALEKLAGGTSPGGGVIIVGPTQGSDSITVISTTGS